MSLQKLILPLCLAAVSINAEAQTSCGFDVKSLDKTCKPCEDFYQYANGGWMKNNPIPAEYPSYGRFAELNNRNLNTLKEILEGLSKAKNTPGSNDQKLGDFYASAMDTVKIENDGYAPIKPWLDEIDAIKDMNGVTAYMAKLHQYGIYTPFIMYAMPDAKNSSRVIANLFQGGLSLPDKDFYLNNDERSEMIKTKFKEYVETLFALTGHDKNTVKQSGELIYRLELAFAKASKGAVELRDPEANYNLMSLEDINKMMKNFSFGNYLKAIGANGVTEINVGQPAFFKSLDSLLASVSVYEWKTELKWSLISGAAPYLSSKFVEAEFNFNSRTLKGTAKMQPRWKKAVGSVDQSLGDALGQAYVKKAFTPEAKKRAMEMIANLKLALREDIKELSWMSAETKKKAEEKLNSFEDKIGYPEIWKDYSTVKIDRNSYVMNIFSAANFEFKYNLDKIGKPVNRKEWGMTPPTVNAYYNPLQNEIVFPAGILQPPCFDPNADDALNYGGMGGVIGHEMTHGFDDQGSQFDAQGNLKNWWTEEDLKNFQAKAQCIIDQFNNTIAIDTIKFKGELVVGEAIADLGGLTIAYIAYKNSLKGKPEPKPIDGLTADQRFFLGWAQVWASNDRDQYKRMMVMTNPHPANKYRVNAPLSNMPAFQKAFNCKEGEKMVRPAKERCEIW